MEEAIRQIEIISRRIEERHEKIGALFAEVLALIEVTKQDFLSLAENHNGK